MQTAWTKSAKAPRAYPALERDHATEVAVIGGGLTGVMTAYLLAKEGLAVTLIEKKRIGMDTTAFTTAFITQVVDTSLAGLISMLGVPAARGVWESHAHGMELIADIIREEKIACEFLRVPARVYANRARDLRDLRRENDLAVELGFPGRVRRANSFGFRNEGVWEVPGQAKFHPLKFVFGLAEKLSRLGVRVHESTEAIDMTGDVRPVVRLKHGKRIRADRVVIATYYPFQKPRATFLKKGMYVSCAIEALLPKGLVPEGIYFDLANPYHYFRIDPAGRTDRLILGGADHREEIHMDERKNYAGLKEHLAAILPGIHPRMVRRWTGPILEPSDGLALIGETAPRQFTATAFSGNGMTYAGITALMARNWVLGRPDPWKNLYDPKRKMTVKSLAKKARDYTGELIGGALRNSIRRVA